MTNQSESHRAVEGEAQTGSTESRIILDKKNVQPRGFDFNYYMGYRLQFLKGQNYGMFSEIVGSFENIVVVAPRFPMPVQPGDKYAITNPLTEVIPLEIPSEDGLEELEETLSKACEILKSYREKIKDI